MHSVYNTKEENEIDFAFLYLHKTPAHWNMSMQQRFPTLVEYTCAYSFTLEQVSFNENLRQLIPKQDSVY